MDKDRIRELLEKVRDGGAGIDEALDVLKKLPYENLGFARTDSHRALRTGYPETVFCQGKTPLQVADIIDKLRSMHSRVIASRAAEETWDAVRARRDDVRYIPEARLILAGDMPAPRTDRKIPVFTAGTSDIPVAEEAACTAEYMGCPAERVYDVGVAGIHRLLDQVDLIMAAQVIIVAAGMEGALPSIIGGLASCPVIAVPTSVGYGSSFGGLSALLTMLNSCAPGIAVVNIDNGFGAGYLAGMINLGGI